MSRPIALVTGASSGLGETFARKLTARGYDLVLTARNEDRLRSLAAQLPTQVKIVVADLASADGVKAVEETIRSTNGLDLLVNNAGFGTTGLFWQTEASSQVAMHQVHVLATMQLTRAALERMVERKHGAIINVSSVAAFAQSVENVSYCATKAWMNSFTEGVAMELKRAGSPVHVQCLCPGFTHTGFHQTMGMDKTKIPKWLWMDADFVVETSLKALDRRKMLVIPGWKYRAVSTIIRHLPIQWRMKLDSPARDKRV